MDVSVIIVNYNTKDLTVNCIKSIYASESKYSFEIILVDNASTDGTVDAIRDLFPQVRIVENTENVGFARANNQAAEITAGRYLYVLNSDTEIEKDVIENVVSYGDVNPDVGVVGTKVVFPDGKLYGNFYKFQTFFTEFMFFTVWLIKSKHWSIFHLNKYNEYSDSEAFEVDVISGCSMFVKRKVYEKIELFDDKFFMYYEDGEFCYRAKKNRFLTIYLPTTFITHIHKGSVKNTYDDHKILVTCFKSACIYMECIKSRFHAHMFKAICSFMWFNELMVLGLINVLFEKDKVKKKIHMLKALLKG